ncbi:MAG: GntR family transcriptional regulator [Methylobacterium sp.]|nr:GntR family transcriptional regulator [Methylobacterium sp.]
MRSRIRQDNLSPGDRLPGEPQLAGELGVSRVTLRRVLDRLMAEGIVERRAGAGTFLRDRGFNGPVILDLASLLGRMEDLSAGLQIEGIDVQDVVPPLPVFGALRLRPGESVRRIARQRMRGGQIFAFGVDYVPGRLADRLSEADLASDWLLGPLIGADNPVERGLQVAGAEAAQGEVARMLGLAGGDPVLSIARSFYDSIGRGVLHTQLFFRADRFNLSFDALRAGFGLRRVEACPLGRPRLDGGDGLARRLPDAAETRERPPTAKNSADAEARRSP